MKVQVLFEFAMIFPNELQAWLTHQCMLPFMRIPSTTFNVLFTECTIPHI